MHQLDGGCCVYDPNDGDVRAYGAATSRTTICAKRGARDIYQTVWEIRRGRSPAVKNPSSEELLYIAKGRGAGTGVYVPPGEEYCLENPDDEILTVIGVCCPEDASRSISDRPASGTARRTVHEADRKPLPATAGREFKYLVDQELGCERATQFVGFIPPSKAPFHHHTYEEAIYILEGAGIVHTESASAPFGPGTCIYLPRLVGHCLENPGTTPVRLMGVFHPAGSPAAAYKD